jgi:hypothetical protein
MTKLASRTPAAVFGLGITALCAALVTPWVFVAGAAVGFDWLGMPAVLPSLLLAVGGSFAVLVRPGGWATVVVTAIGLLAIYMAIALARSIPTVGAVWADADAKPGPGFLLALASQTLIVVSVWLAGRSRKRQTAATAA